MSFLSPKIIDAATRHARRVFPEESCGLVVGDTYVPCDNVANDPTTHEEGNPDCDCRLCSFRIDTFDAMHAKGFRCVLHSHPNGPVYPSARDMQGQVQTGVPWGIIPLDAEREGPPFLWGDGLPVAPLIGRTFIHGIADCYSVIRDAYRLGREKLVEHGIEEWPFDPITLPEVPRNDNWWSNGEDLYVDHFEGFGFHKVPASDVQPGDIFMMKLGSRRTNPNDRINHAGLYIGKNLILHHLPTRASRREPATIWRHAVSFWIRYGGVDA